MRALGLRALHGGVGGRGRRGWPCSCSRASVMAAGAVDSLQIATVGKNSSRCTEVISVGGVELQGVSVAGQETCLVLPRYKLAFDIGRCPQRAVAMETVLVSHAHLDHIGGIPFHIASRSLLGLTPSRVVLPAANVQGLHALCEVHRQLDGSDMPVDAVGLQPGEEMALRGDTWVRAFPTVHPVPSQGYLLLSRRHKLRPEYAGLPGPEIRALRERGVAVTEAVDSPEVAFTGDTSLEFVDLCCEKDPQVLKAKLLILELTFVDDDVTPEGAREMGHGHVQDLLARIDRFRDVGHVLLIHFSARYKAQQVREALEAHLPDWFKAKCTLLLERYA